jgi:hypothetical protein
MTANQFGGLDGTAVLAIWSDAAAAHEDEFNSWYTSQHLPERVGVPGFRRGRRYVKDGPGELRYFTLYETADIHVLESGPYLERLNNPTAWTRRVLPYFRNGSRLAMRVTSSAGAGVGGLAATISFGPSESGAAELRGWTIALGDQLRAKYPSLIGWHLCESDDQVTQAKAGTEEARASRPGAAAATVTPRRSPRWMLMAEATDRAALESAGELLAASSGLAAQGATAVGEFHRYRLMIALSPASGTAPEADSDGGVHG